MRRRQPLHTNHMETDPLVGRWLVAASLLKTLRREEARAAIRVPFLAVEVVLTVLWLDSGMQMFSRLDKASRTGTTPTSRGLPSIQADRGSHKHLVAAAMWICPGVVAQRSHPGCH